MNRTSTPAPSQKTLDAYFQYLELSNLLFDNNKTEIYNVSDIPIDNKFFKLAKKKAANLKIKWNTMSHEDSNRIMLAMLEDAFNLMRDIENSKSITVITTIKTAK